MPEETKTKKFARVHRALYKFNIQRLFIPIKRYAKKATEITPQVLINSISSLFQPKKKEETKVIKPARRITTPSPLLNVIIIVFLCLIAIGAYFIFVYYTTPGVPEVPIAVELSKPNIVVNVLSSGYLDSSSDQTRWFVLLDVLAQNTTELNFDFVVQQQFIPNDVYILKVPNYQFASNYPQFYSRLKSSLERKGLFLSEITIEEMVSLPKTRKIILIVPSGYLPAVFIGEEYKNFTLKKFVENGNVLIYIGYKPTDSVLYSSLPNPQPISQEKIADWQLSFDSASGQPQFFSFKNPLYSIKSIGTAATRPIISGDPGGFSIKWEGDGFAYFIPTTIDFWWQFSGEKSADELADAIINARWGYGLSRIQKTLQVNGSFKGQIILFTSPFRFPDGTRVTRSYGKLYLQGINKVNNVTEAVGSSISVRFPMRPKGLLMHDDSAINSFISGNPLEIKYSLNENTTELKQLYLSAINQNNEEVLFIPITAAPVPLKLSNAVYRFDNQLKSGEYILRISDDKRNTFAQSYLSMLSFKIEPYITDFLQGNFIFNVYILPSGEEYTSVLKNIEVSLDGGDVKRLDATKGRIIYNATPITAPGMYTFTFKFGPDVISVPVQYTRPVSMFERPENIAMGIIAILLFAIGYLISRPEAVKYAIDVPDFPPLQSIAVPIKREKILEIFDQVNADLKWKNTPLTINDLKMGFRKIMFRGKPLLVGDYNLEMILDKLKEEGYVVQSMEYYGLKRWEKETRKSIYYLALVRALRDIFVTEGIPFLPFGQRGDADTVLSYGGENVYVHIYESDAVIKKAIYTSSIGRTIIVFENESVMNDFLSRIHTPDRQNVVFKLLLDNGKISVAPINKFMSVLQKKVVFTY
ncbi:MAG: hypothetical protein N3G74_01250 [Candidatus Micrarchaeota archaeon]|nr:hypothetical protein [Candidatus Micrarchaeota archaeon]